MRLSPSTEHQRSQIKTNREELMQILKKRNKMWMSFLLCRTLTLPTPLFPSTSFPIPHKCRGRCNKTTPPTPTTTAIRWTLSIEPRAQQFYSLWTDLPRVIAVAFQKASFACIKPVPVFCALCMVSNWRLVMDYPWKMNLQKDLIWFSAFTRHWNVELNYGILKTSGEKWRPSICLFQVT